MPKPMSMTVEIEQIAFGRVFQTLDGMPGVINIKIHAHGPRPADASKITKTKKGNGTARGPTTRQLVLDALAAGPQTKQTLGLLFEGHGKKAASVPSTIQELTKRKHVISDGKANYKITAAGRTALKKEEK